VGGIVADEALKLVLLGVDQNVLTPFLAGGLSHSAVLTHVVLDASMPEKMIL